VEVAENDDDLPVLDVQQKSSKGGRNQAHRQLWEMTPNPRHRWRNARELSTDGLQPEDRHQLKEVSRASAWATRDHVQVVLHLSRATKAPGRGGQAGGNLPKTGD
jgi:hypothetical protein